MFTIVLFVSPLVECVNIENSDVSKSTKKNFGIFDNFMSSEFTVYETNASKMGIDYSFILPDNPILKILGIKTSDDVFKKMYLERKQAFRDFLVKKQKEKKNNFVSIDERLE